MKVGFVLFEKWHNKRDVGSSRIRGHWLIKYWPEAEIYKAGHKYDAIIFQKVYWIEFAEKYQGIKILDICDPDWMDLQPVKQMIDNCDAVTCSSPALVETIKKFTNKPVYFVADRIDFDYVGNIKKVHKDRAKEVCWFGYRHNAYVLKAVLPHLRVYKLNLSIISEDFTTVCDYGNEDFRQNERWTKWALNSVNEEIIKSDFVIMPDSTNPKAKYKSDNKITMSWALGMPVARTLPELKRFLDPVERQKEADEKYKFVRENYDVRQSVEEMKKVIKEIYENRGRLV